MTHRITYLTAPTKLFVNAWRFCHERMCVLCNSVWTSAIELLMLVIYKKLSTLLCDKRWPDFFNQSKPADVKPRSCIAYTSMAKPILLSWILHTIIFWTVSKNIIIDWIFQHFLLWLGIYRFHVGPNQICLSNHQKKLRNTTISVMKLIQFTHFYRMGHKGWDLFMSR